MDPGQVGANGESAAKPVEEVGGGEIGNVHLLCMGGDLVVGRRLRLVTAEMMPVLVRITSLGKGLKRALSVVFYF